MNNLKITKLTDHSVEVSQENNWICCVCLKSCTITLNTENFPKIPLFKAEKESFKQNEDLLSEYNQNMFRRVGNRVNSLLNRK